jgi:multiple sugar transport system permease protein
MAEKLRKFWNKPSHIAYLFVSPVIILLLVFSIFPMLASFYYSLYDADIFLSASKFIALGNFKEALGDARFWNGLKVTLKFTFVEVPAQLIVALFLAALLTKNTMRNKFFRAVYFLPIICSATAVSIMFRMFLHSQVGIFTYFLDLLGIKGVNFLNTLGLTFYVIVFLSVWRSFGISTVILVSAMQNVPTELYESAELDGCSKIKQFFKITLPLIMPTFAFILITRLIGSRQVFDIIFTTTGGDPYWSTESLVVYIYTRAFSTTNRMGYASALSMFLFALILILTVLIYFKMFKKENEA